jgi:hypothetical protein
MPLPNVLQSPFQLVSPKNKFKKQINNRKLPAQEHVDHDEYKEINKERERIII